VTNSEGTFSYTYS